MAAQDIQEVLKNIREGDTLYGTLRGDPQRVKLEYVAPVFHAFKQKVDGTWALVGWFNSAAVRKRFQPE